MEQPLVLCPMGTNYHGLWIDQREAAKAAADLGVYRPTRVVWGAFRRKNGDYRYVDGWHQIRLSTYISDPAQVTRTLMHELAHAHQRDRRECPPEVVGQEHRANLREHGYHDAPHEVEARKIAQENAHQRLGR